MSKLHIPNSVALRNFDILFKGNVFRPWNSPVSVEFHPTYVAMHPVGLAFYAPLGDLWRGKGLERRGKLNASIKSVPYLQSMGLFKAMGFVDPRQINKHEEYGRFIPLTKIKNSTELTALIATIDPLLHTSRERSNAIKHVISELVRNVIEHSSSPTGANVCAVYSPKQRKVMIGISDAGKGLFSAIAKSHDVKGDRDAIVKALTPGITGSTSRIGGNEQNAGAGLFFTKCIAQASRNHFVIYSGSAYFKLLPGKPDEKVEFHSDPEDDHCRIRTDLPYFEGTLVGVDLDVDDNSAFRELAVKIGTAYQLGVKKNKKDYTKKIRFT
jgi:anti-sigma regulatory factor (Ser/Thr protein kinase)